MFLNNLIGHFDLLKEVNIFSFFLTLILKLLNVGVIFQKPNNIENQLIYWSLWSAWVNSWFDPCPNFDISSQKPFPWSRQGLYSFVEFKGGSYTRISQVYKTPWHFGKFDMEGDSVPLICNHLEVHYLHKDMGILSESRGEVANLVPFKFPWRFVTRDLIGLVTVFHWHMHAWLSIMPQELP